MAVSSWHPVSSQWSGVKQRNSRRQRKRKRRRKRELNTETEHGEMGKQSPAVSNETAWKQNRRNRRFKKEKKEIKEKGGVEWRCTEVSEVSEQKKGDEKEK